MRGVGIYPVSHLTFADHLVPLCQIMGIPLLSTSAWIKEMIDLYYPPMEVKVAEAEDYLLDPYLEDDQVLFTVDSYRLATGALALFDYFIQKPHRTVASLHGNSDKMRTVYKMEHFVDEEILLLYGPYYLDFLKEKGILNRMQKIIITGNFRYAFYKKHQAFFDSLLPEIKSDGRRVILWAPTWSANHAFTDNRFDYSSVLESYRMVLEGLPKEYYLIVKFHPFFLHNFPDEAASIKELYQKRENIHFIDNFPLIYPLLQKVDLYLGDYSSIGYDFLTFNRPLFFLHDGRRDSKSDKGLTLFQTGKIIEPADQSRLYQIIDEGMKEESRFAAIREKSYRFAFGIEKSLDVLKKEIEEAVQ